MVLDIRRLAFGLALTLALTAPAISRPAHASGVCGDGVVDMNEECDPGGALVFDGNPSLGPCTTGTDCFYALSCCKFNCQYVGQGASCFDGEECTANDLCNQVGQCIGDPVASGTDCDDDSFCTLVDQCNSQGHCIGGGDPCAGGPECNDTCNEADLSCTSPSGTACGDPTGSQCTEGDTCNGLGSCVANDAAPGTPAPATCDDGNDCSVDECDGNGGCRHVAAGAGQPCGDPSDSECGNPDSCDGAGACVGNDEAPGVPCGDPTDGECTDPDSCDGAGNCVGNDAAAGTPAATACADGNDCTADVCNGAGACTNPPSAAGSACGDGTADECTAADSCDGGGNCLPNHAPSGTPAPTECGDANACTEDQCDGAGGCLYVNLASGAPCGDPTTTSCSDPDICSGDGACLPNHQPAGMACGDASFTDCTMPDVCDGAGSCSNNDFPDGATCDDSDYCTIGDVCSNGACNGGEPLSCADDGDNCTHDYCDSDAAACVHPIEPKPFCHDAGIGQIVVVNKSDDSKDKLKWKWIRGLPVDFANVGDPSASTELELCLFDVPADSPAELRGRLLIPPSSLWQVIGNQKGYRYLDPTRSIGGVKLIKLKTGESPKFGVKAERENLQLPAPVIPPDGQSKGRYFNVDPMFSAQLVGSNGECWTADFESVKKNTGRKFKSRRRGVVIK